MAQSQSSRFRVVVMDDYEELASQAPSLEKLKARADVMVLKGRLATEEERVQQLKDAHAVVLVRERTRFGEREFSLLPSLKFISQTGGGIAHIDLPSATRHNIAVSVTRGSASTSTVELTLGLILSVNRKISEVDRGMHQGGWPAIAGRVLEGKTVGVIGLGRIGREVARLVAAFGTRIVATGKTLTDQRAREAGAMRVSLDQLLQESDVVTVHVSLSPETRGLIGEREISLVNPGAVLINTSRGPIVSQSALMLALETGRLAGAGLDVYDEEPLPADHPLRRFDNVVLCSHRGYAAFETLCERYEAAYANILAYLDGQPINLLNPDVISTR